MLFVVIFRQNLARAGILIFLISCASNAPTTYHPKTKGEGFYEEKAEESLGLVSFKANENTKKSDADLYAKFRSIEICREQGHEFAHILGAVDKSKSKKLIRTSNTGYPSSYYYGMSPYYNRYSNFGVGFSSFEGNSWSETYEFPEVEVRYRCEDTIFEPELLLREVTPEEMKLLVKDLRGGLQVEKILEDSPNKGVIEYGDVILKVNGLRIQKVWQLLQVMTQSAKKASLDIMREGQKMNIVLKSMDVSSSVKKMQQEIIRSACNRKNMEKRLLCD